MQTTTIAALWLLFQPLLFAQTSTLVDVFPLAVGNQWTYRHTSYFFFTEIGQQWTCSCDGEVRFTVVDAVRAPDSTDWTIALRQNLNGVMDSSSFVATEYLTRAHPLRARGNVLRDLCGFYLPFGDSVDRYMPVDAGGYAVSGPMILKAGVGETRYSYDVEGDPIRKIDDTLVDFVVTSTADIKQKTRPSEYTLEQNYPNPFNPSTTIRFWLPVAGHVRLVIYDLSGKAVETLVDQGLSAGRYENVFVADGLPSGVYFCRLTSRSFSETRKLLIMR